MDVLAFTVESLERDREMALATGVAELRERGEEMANGLYDLIESCEVMGYEWSDES